MILEDLEHHTLSGVTIYVIGTNVVASKLSDGDILVFDRTSPLLRNGALYIPVEMEYIDDDIRFVLKHPNGHSEFKYPNISSPMWMRETLLTLTSHWKYDPLPSKYNINLNRAHITPNVCTIPNQGYIRPCQE